MPVLPGTIDSTLMTIKSSGSSLSFTEISDEFGFPPDKNLGAYRVSQM